MKRTLIFLAITFGLTWTIQIAAGLALGTFTTGENASATMIGIIAASMFIPTVGAFTANRAVAPDERVNLALHPHVKGNVGVYLIAWFSPALITLAGLLVFFLVFPQLFDPTFSSARELAAAAGTPIGTDTMTVMAVATAFAALTIAPFINMIPAVGEEIGWRGMLYPSLCTHLSERAAIVASGVIWGLWHAPVIAMGHNYGMDYPGFPIAGIATMTLTCTCFGALLAWLRDRSGSVWPCALAHGSFNAIANIGIAVCAAPISVLGPSPLALVSGIPLIALGSVLILRAPERQERGKEKAAHAAS